MNDPQFTPSTPALGPLVGPLAGSLVAALVAPFVGALVGTLAVAMPAHGQSRSVRPPVVTAPATSTTNATTATTATTATAAHAADAAALHVDALIGLARVARDADDFASADEYFTRAGRLRTFDEALRREHADVFDRWASLAEKTGDHGMLAEAAASAQRAFPNVARWPRRLGDSLLQQGRPRDAAAAFAQAAAAADATPADRAMQAVALEHASDHRAAAEAWQRVPDASRRHRADWWASALRTRAVGDGRASVADEIVAFVRAHPADASMRALAVESLADASRFTEALALLTPAGVVPGDARTRRREGQLALAAGDRARAARAFRALERTESATAADRWQLAELTAATASAAETIGRLRVLTSADTACHDRALTIADLASSDEVAASVALARPAICPLPERLAVAASRWLRARGDAGDADTLLSRALATHPGSYQLALMITERRLAQGDHAAARRVIDTHLASADVMLTADAAATWAGLAMAAEADATAARLARLALRSDRDVEARHILASLAHRRGDPRQAFEWLDPVKDQLSTSTQTLAWLDAVAALRGPAAALADGRRRWHAPVPADPADIEIAARLARWIVEAGESAPTMASAAENAQAMAADTLVAYVRAADPVRARRLVLERLLTEGQATRVVETLIATGVGALAADDLRLLVTAALDGRAWPTARTAIEEWLQRGLAADWADLKRAELEIKRDGRLSREMRAALDARVAAQDADVDEVRIRLAQDASARGDHEAALARLADVLPVVPHTPIAVRRALVEVLAVAGRPQDVLDVVPPDGTWPTDLRSARAHALIAMNRRAEAREILVSLPVSRRSVHDWRRLADLTASATERMALLESSLAHVPDRAQAPLLAALAVLQQQAGQPAAARATALRALALDDQEREAWRVRLAVRPASAIDREVDLAAAARVLTLVPDMGIELAEAALDAGTPSAGEVAVLRGWLEAAEGPHSGRNVRLRIRLAIATGDWSQALDVLAQARADEPDDMGLRRLEAQVHAWSGDHRTGAQLYASYLHAAPDDSVAWREYGRLLSWMQQADAAAHAYEQAARLAPAPALEAEARTKAALARQAWGAASTAAAEWLTREPDSLDARMDRALTLDRTGQFGEASRLFAELATAHDLPADLRRSARRYGLRHRPEASLAWETSTEEGFEGQQRIERRLLVGSAADRRGPGGAMRLFATVGRGTLDARTTMWNLTTFQAGLDGRPGGAWHAAGMAGASMLSAGAGGGPGGRPGAGVITTTIARGALSRTVRDGVLVAVSAERRPFWENGATAAAGLAATGGGLRVEWQAGAHWAVQGRLEGHALSDGNRRHEGGASLAWRGRRGNDDVEIRASTFTFGYRDAAAAYFSPASFLRTDIEGQLRHWFGRPRSDSFRRAFVEGGLGLGVDSRQARYGLGQARISLPVHPAWAIVAEGRWVQASVYEASSVGLWLQVGR